MSELLDAAESHVKRHSDIVDKIAEVAFYRGKITKRVEIKSKLIKALENNQIDFNTFKLVEQILSEE